ncbi:hypothetical protein [Halobellus rubicundus]|uniref:Uncharacterized protein n=1 Tax=Halobellus rubicundus TaxID=2996466 RepID=A0ABD5MAU2_9EURY
MVLEPSAISSSSISIFDSVSDSILTTYVSLVERSASSTVTVTVSPSAYVDESNEIVPGSAAATSTVTTALPNRLNRSSNTREIDRMRSRFIKFYSGRRRRIRYRMVVLSARLSTDSVIDKLGRKNGLPGVTTRL